jgi:hypothetical protein
LLWKGVDSGKIVKKAFGFIKILTRSRQFTWIERLKSIFAETLIIFSQYKDDLSSAVMAQLRQRDSWFWSFWKRYTRFLSKCELNEKGNLRTNIRNCMAFINWIQIVNAQR